MSIESKQRLLEKALEEGRELSQRTDLNDEERADLFKRVETIESLKAEISTDLRIKAALQDETGASGDDAEHAVYATKSLGHSFVESEEFLVAKAANFLGNSRAFVYKTEPTEITTIGDGSAMPGLVVPQRIPGIQGLPTYPTKVADLLPKMSSGSNTISYFLEVSETGGPAPQDGEGAEKAEFTLDGEEKTEKLEVVGAMAAITRQTLADAPFLAGFVNTRMTLKLDQVREDLILNGDGTNGELVGFAERTTSTLGAGADTDIDAIYKAADLAWTDGGYPSDAIVINPADWQPIVLSKDGNERYYGTGPFANAIGDTLWGLPVVKSPLQTEGIVLVGAFGAGSFLAKSGGVELRTSDSHADYFKKNKVAILIEERLCLGVPAPLAFTLLDLNGS